MNKKGFTLVEMIGVVIILSLIILIITPTISESLKGSRNRAYQVQIDEIESAARSWSIYNSDNLPEKDEEIIITLLQLKLGGFLSLDLKNPKNGELFPDDMQIKITKKGLNYVYTVLEDTGSGSIESIDPQGPQLVLNGSTYMYVEVGSEFTIPNATYKNDNGNNVIVTDIQYKKKINGEVTSVDNIDFSELGSYIVIYSATINGRTNNIQRYVEVVDTTPPEIVIAGYTNGVCVDTEMSGLFMLPSATITDNYTPLIEAETIGNISNVPGKKEIRYIAKDSSNNTSEFVLCINMKDTTKPTINNVEVVYSDELKANIVRISASDSGVGLHKNAYSFDGGSTWQKDDYIVLNSDSVTVVVRDKIGLQSEPQTVSS